MTMIFNEKQNKLSDLLRELSSLEADEIAALLKSEGIKGKARKCSSCPMAAFLNKRLAGEHFVTLTNIYFYDYDADDFADQHSVQTPKTVRKFIASFDSGKYLFLDSGRPIE